MTRQEKLTRLHEVLRSLPPAWMAVSGGVDSRFLAYTAWGLGLDWPAVFFSGPHLTPQERARALAWLRESAPLLYVINTSPLKDPQARENTRERCYHCKLACFGAALTRARAQGAQVLLDGGNVSDAKEYRPGRKALAELEVRSPLAEAGLDKSDIRALARQTGLDRPEQPSRACLLTRFAYDLPPAEAELEQVGRAEDALAALGLDQFRVRVTAPGTYVLQLAEAERPGWAEVEQVALGALDQEGVAPVQLVWSDTVSGFFDRKDES
jgi:pyridinium-3,5-biscarboxylic acid mononucleotide sulfurtransferase